MFGLTPEDLADRARSLPSPEPASLGVRRDAPDDTEVAASATSTNSDDEIDWSMGFDDEDLRAACCAPPHLLVLHIKRRPSRIIIRGRSIRRHSGGWHIVRAARVIRRGKMC